MNTKKKTEEKKLETKKKLLEKLEAAAKKNPNIVFVGDAVKAMCISKTKYYEIFSTDEDKEAVDKILEANKTELKFKIREKLLNNRHPAALIALYRLVGNQDERIALNPTANEKMDDTENKTKIKLTIE